MEAAAIPLPSEETTPPVMKMKRVSPWAIPLSESIWATGRYRRGRGLGVCGSPPAWRRPPLGRLQEPAGVLTGPR
jgi:hypothetical protein